MRTLIHIAQGYVFLAAVVCLIFAIIFLAGGYPDSEFEDVSRLGAAGILFGVIVGCAVYEFIIFALMGFSDEDEKWKSTGWFRKVVLFFLTAPLAIYTILGFTIGVGAVLVAFLLISGGLSVFGASLSGWSFFSGWKNGVPFSIWIKKWW